MQSLGSQYSRRERLLDAVVHGTGASLSLIAIAILVAALQSAPSAREPATIVATAAYGFGLLAMIWLSAAYNVVTDPQWKERLRRYDHAAIFLMIAGTYTPFALISLGGSTGHALLALVWIAAIAGAVVKLRMPRRYERLAVVAYLALGWAGLPLLDQLLSAVPQSTLLLIGIGGLLYTAGVAFHLSTRLRFHNAVWHAFVLAAATCHFLAVLNVVAA